MSTGLHAMTGAYATHALTGAERLAFERHLDACPACAEELRELTEPLARLAPAVAVPPPPALWDRVRAEAAATPQADRQRRSESVDRRPKADPTPLPASVDRRPQADPTPFGRRPKADPKPLFVAAALLLVVAISVAALTLGLPGRGGRSERTVDLVAAVLAAPDARRVVARAGETGEVAVVVSRRRGQAVLEASGLPAAPAGRTYQLWVVDRSGPRPAGLVEAGGGGRVTRLLDGRVTGSEQVAMSVEPRGGSARPTSEPVLVIDLPA